MNRRWREAHALRAARHRGIIDGLHVDPVVVEQRVGHRLAVDWIADHHRHDVARIFHHWQARFAHQCLDLAHALLQARPLNLASL